MAGLALAVAAYILPPPRYTAYALLQIASKPPQVAFTILETRAETKDELDKYQKTQLELLKSRFVLNAALRDPQVVGLASVREKSDPLEWLIAELNVEFLNGSDIVKIALRGENANDVAVIVNAVTSAYLREVVTLEEGKRRRRMEQLQDAYDALQAKLADKRQFFRNIAKAAGSNNQKTLAYKQTLELEVQAAAERELQDCRAELRRVRAELEVAEAAGRDPKEKPAPRSDAHLAQILAQDDHYRDLEDVVERARADVKKFRRPARLNSDPAVARSQQKLDAAVSRLESYRDTIAARLEEGSAGGGVDRISELKGRLAVLTRLEESAAEDVKRLTARTNASNETTLDLQSREDDIAHMEQAAKKLGDDLEALKVELKAEQRITERERADVPRRKEDKRPLLFAMGGSATFFLVLLGFSWNEFRARRIDCEDHVTTSLGINVVGSLPALPYKHRRSGGGNALGTRRTEWHNLLVESIDAARTMILHAARERGCRVLMITSAMRGEGKTSLSCQLAMSLARAGRRTLLIDCDLRKPSVHRFFDEPLGRGFSELLRGETEVGELVRPLPVPGLSLLTAGQCDPRALQALVRHEIGTTLSGLTATYDFIIVDSAPLLAVTDSLVLAQHVDSVLFSILSETSRVPWVQSAYDRLAALGVTCLGAVLSGARMDPSRYGQYLKASVVDAGAREAS
jgi:capsular exopolysaccharide synthesis family protein